MIEAPAIDLKIVQVSEMSHELQKCFRGGDVMSDRPDGPKLPTHFYEVPSWDAAMQVQFAPNFGLWELIDVDYREAEEVRLYPRYVPCALAVMAGYLQLLRNEVGRVVRIAANGGYRSPAHRSSSGESAHCWGTAVNIYRIGDDWMDSRETIEKYAEVAHRILPSAWVRPYGESVGSSFDHLHIDLGFFSVHPHHGRAQVSLEQ